MFHKRSHLSDQELLLAADGELTRRREIRVSRHLAKCAACRARRSAIARSLDAAAQSWSQHPSARLPAAAASRAQLRMRLAELSRQPALSPGFWPPRWALACAAIIVAGVGLFSIPAGRATDAFYRSLDGESGVSLRPLADMTPGAAQPVSIVDVCGPGRYGRTRAIPASVHQRVFERYGADYGRSAEYELDYLITPELGGTSDPRNLWPQPFAGTPWNAYVKDELEQHLHRLACDGQIDFATAQRDIATDWIAAYKRYFQTDTPRRDYASSPLTERDGDLLRSELEELGVPIPADRSDGPTLMAMLRAARLSMEPQVPSSLHGE